MWFGKIAIIMYLFSISCLFWGYFLNDTVFHDPTLTANQSLSYNATKTLANSFALNQPVNASLIFGDFLAGLTLLFSIVTGGTIASAFSIFPFVNTGIMLLIQISFSASSVFLWIYIVANRSV